MVVGVAVGRTYRRVGRGALGSSPPGVTLAVGVGAILAVGLWVYEGNSGDLGWTLLAVGPAGALMLAGAARSRRRRLAADHGAREQAPPRAG